MNHGRAVAVHGSVIEVRFPPRALPAIEEAIAVEWDLSRPPIAKVQHHLNATTV
jgi:F-type H+-transporting ATPase subunit beta